MMPNDLRPSESRSHKESPCILCSGYEKNGVECHFLPEKVIPYLGFDFHIEDSRDWTTNYERRFRPSQEYVGRRRDLPWQSVSVVVESIAVCKRVCGRKLSASEQGRPARDLLSTATFCQFGPMGYTYIGNLEFSLIGYLVTYF